MRPGWIWIAGFLTTWGAGCSSLPVRPVAPTAAARVVVLPFRTGGDLGPDDAFVARPERDAVPEELGAAAAHTLAEHMRAVGWEVREDGSVRADEGLPYDVPRATQVAARTDAVFVVLGAIGRYRQRVGSAWGVESPASVWYQVVAVRAADGTVVARDRFEYTQQALSDNLLNLPWFVATGAHWVTREEMLAQALEQTAARLATAINGTPQVAQPLRAR